MFSKKPDAVVCSTLQNPTSTNYLQENKNPQSRMGKLSMGAPPQGKLSSQFRMHVHVSKIES